MKIRNVTLNWKLLGILAVIFNVLARFAGEFMGFVLELTGIILIPMAIIAGARAWRSKKRESVSE